MPDPTTCPKCGSDDLHRDEVDVGVGTIYGPYGCLCGWSEWPEYDRSEGPSPKQLELGPEWYVDSTGGAHRVSAIAERLERFRIPRAHTKSVFRYEEPKDD